VRFLILKAIVIDRRNHIFVDEVRDTLTVVRYVAQVSNEEAVFVHPFTDIGFRLSTTAKLSDSSLMGPRVKLQCL
jgi:hypothetical protein